MRSALVIPGIFLLLLAAPQPTLAQRNLAGAAEVTQALQTLSVNGSVLMIAAHPDDENTALLAWLARGKKVRTGYLSLTRGEGGQNLIGSEQGRFLGLIRTQELMAARRIDGAEQFFTRAVDFGFTKTVDETLEKWGRERTLGDIVYVIRKFRPDVIVLRFSGTPRDGHGQHQASAILGKEAFTAAADSTRFPEQLKEVQPWKARRLMWNVFAFTREQEQQAQALKDKIEVDLGEYNPLLGYSYSEIAGLSRSQHVSQGMGSAERRGSSKNYFTTIAGEPAKQDLLEGVSLNRSPPELASLLKDAAAGYDPANPEKTVSMLMKARLLVISEALRGELDNAIGLCAGLWLDASAAAPTAAPGSTVRITTEVINRSRVPMQLQSIRIGEMNPIGTPQPLAYNQPAMHTTDWVAGPVQRPILREQPLEPPVTQARFQIAVDGVPLTFVRPVHHRFVDPVRGELTRPFEVVPALSVRFAESTMIFPSTGPRVLDVNLKSWGSNMGGKVAGRLRLDVPTGWRVSPPSQEFELSKSGEERTLRFSVTPPATSTTAEARAVASSGDTEMSTSVQVIAYPHIPPITILASSTATLVRADVKVLSKRVGYIMGAGDEIPAALRQIGCEVALLSHEDLTHGDLNGFNAIVTGVRAFNTRPDLRASLQRLLDYVQQGGTMVVQYNVPEGGFFSKETGALDRIGPYPLKTGRERVTVEEAPVEFLRSEHPLLTVPNRISTSDFEGWVQERGLYFASEWDPKYETLIATQDPSEKPLPGGLLYARHGKGAYVFTSYSWFRQLPAGVPGAYRIFANLLSAGMANKQ